MTFTGEKNMSSTASTKIPRWFWLAAGGALIWNLIGVMTYIVSVTMSADAIAALPEAEQRLREATPVFVTSAYAIAVFTGTFGAIFLLLRRNWAVPAYSISLVALLVQFGYMFLAVNSIAATGVASAILPAIIIIIGLLMLRFSHSARRKGWLR